MHKKIKIKRFDKSIALPPYKTTGAAGFDLAARITLTIAPKKIEYIPLNVAVETPKGYFLLLAPRSSTHKLGLIQINGVAIGDPDFRGDEDEYKMAVYNFTDKAVMVEKGTRIAQGVFIKFTKAVWVEVDKMKAKTRGGFGSTGKK